MRDEVATVEDELSRAVSQLLWSHKGREEWFSLGENHERRRRSPDFLQRGTSSEKRCAAFFAESRMQFGGLAKIHRKSGFGLHQLRNRYNGLDDWGLLRPESPVLNHLTA